MSYSTGSKTFPPTRIRLFERVTIAKSLPLWLQTARRWWTVYLDHKYLLVCLMICWSYGWHCLNVLQCQKTRKRMVRITCKSFRSSSVHCLCSLSCVPLSFSTSDWKVPSYFSNNGLFTCYPRSPPLPTGGRKEYQPSVWRLLWRSASGCYF